MIVSTLSFAALVALATAHGNHGQKPIAGPHKSLWYNTLPGDGGTQKGATQLTDLSAWQADAVFSGISTFGRLPYFPCLASDEEKYDIAFIDQAPALVPAASDKVLAVSISSMFCLQKAEAYLFDQKGSRKLGFSGGYNVPLEANPFHNEFKILDCGDIPVTSYDNTWALQQIEDGHNTLLMRKPYTDADKKGLSKTGKVLPRIITLGGDHTITLPLLRSINKAYGPVTVIHFDSHLTALTHSLSSRDTWKPKVFGGSPSEVASINHGTYFYHAAQEGLLRNDTNIHAGIRTTLSGPSDYENDGYCGFEIVEAREIDTIGTDGIIKKIRDRVGDNPVYLSIDIDTLDPACEYKYWSRTYLIGVANWVRIVAPATGTPETGGWSTRELRTIIRGLDGINFVGADIVEVAPAYDTNAEHTTMAAADVLYEVLTIMVKNGPLTA
ncbi:Agmatinase [Rasamsonia emersonii CBS 393.64]|uniref:Agmatinase n=1 Tax=Rasamsonia emersonii (strain ATCC 16479 / CBS 393.64 / IMI 116815) TaxID=1408163 RepID=A0A0F4Z2I8_RASE3|nr:Agmatinase [Rasamsonia emersonii CBS 393.64]KKA24098.1 Agmatinase [Rasamsonia emersonii CBS 393.64]